MTKAEEINKLMNRNTILESRIARVGKMNPKNKNKQALILIQLALQIAFNRSQLMVISALQPPKDFHEGGFIAPNNADGEFIFPQSSSNRNNPNP